MKQAVIYTRYNGNDINICQQSIDEQIAKCKQYAADHFMYIRRIYIDDAPIDSWEAFLPKKQMLLDCRQDWDIVLVTDMSRLGRKQNDLERCLSRLYRNNKQVICVNSNLTYEEQLMHVSLMKQLSNFIRRYK